MRSFKMLVYLWLISNVSIYAQSKINSDGGRLNYPVPVKTEKLLFYIQRSFNKNTIAYELNLDHENKIIYGDPIHPYWIRYEDEGERKELSYIERKFAYGIKIEQQNKQDSSYQIALVSYPINMELKKSIEDNTMKVYITVNGKLIELKMIYFKTEGGTFWKPNIKYIDIFGFDVKTKLEISERILP
ncbi:MAG: DUF4833 domain-containing protein [Prolixibacteraceae bacterium]